MSEMERKDKRRLKIFLVLAGLAFVVVAIALPVSTSARPYYDYTSIPCSGCHSNGGTGIPVPGLLTITGLPAQYTPGTKYALTVTMTDANGPAVGQNNFDMTTDKGAMDSGYSGVQIQNGGLAARGNVTGYTASVWYMNWTAPASGSGAATLDFWGVNGDGVIGTLDPFGETTLVITESLSLPDTTAPITNATLNGTVGADNWFRSNVSVSLLANDTESGVNTTFYRIGVSGSWLSYSSSFVLSSEGNSTVQFYSTDYAGNIESVKNISVKIDKTPPAGTIVIQEGAIFANGTAVTLNLSASDDISGLEQFRISNDGTTWSSWKSWQNLSDHMSWNLQIGDGLKTVFFQTMDNASNYATYSDIIIIDTAPPELTFKIANLVDFVGSSATINWSATDANGPFGYEYSLDGGAFISRGFSTYVDLSNLTIGSHNITIRAIDGAGNAADRTLQFFIIAAGPSSGTSSMGDLAPWLLVIIAILAIMLLLLFLLRRKGEKTPAEAPMATPPPLSP